MATAGFPAHTTGHPVVRGSSSARATAAAPTSAARISWTFPRSRWCCRSKIAKRAQCLRGTRCRPKPAGRIRAGPGRAPRC
jgi:hypothetical protein